MTGVPPGSLALRARHVVLRPGTVLDNGWLRILAGRVVEVGRGSGPGGCLDLGESIVLPGLVNAHTHLEFSDLAEPLDATGGLPAWIARIVALRRGRPAGPGSAEAAIRTGLAEAARGGVTAVGEIATALPRGPLPHGSPRVRLFREALGLSPTAGHSATAAVSRDVRRLAAGGGAAGVSPHAPYSVAAALGRDVLALARRLRLPAAMHLAESPAEAELVACGTGPLRAVLESLGAWPDPAPRLLPAADWISLLGKGPRGIVVHATYLDDAALARLSRHRGRLAVAICPRTTRRLSGTLPPLVRLRSAGVRVALGTDSRGSNPDLSLLDECRTLVDSGLASPAEAFAMATLDGAWALGFEREAGVLSPGRPADLVVLRPAPAARDPLSAAVAPETVVQATLRAGAVIHGSLTA